MCPITGSQWSPPSNTTFPQESVESNKAVPWNCFLQTWQVQSSQLLLTGYVFHPFHWLCCPPLDPLEHLNILFVLWGPELHTGLNVEVALMLSISPFFCLAGYAAFDAPGWGLSSGLPGHSLLAHTELVSTTIPRSPSAGLPLSHARQSPAIVFIKFCCINHCPMVQSICTPSVKPLIPQER